MDVKLPPISAHSIAPDVIGTVRNLRSTVRSFWSSVEDLRFFVGMMGHSDMSSRHAEDRRRKDSEGRLRERNDLHACTVTVYFWMKHVGRTQSVSWFSQSQILNHCSLTDREAELGSRNACLPRYEFKEPSKPFANNATQVTMLQEQRRSLGGVPAEGSAPAGH